MGKAFLTGFCCDSLLKGVDFSTVNGFNMLDFFLNANEVVLNVVTGESWEKIESKINLI